MNRDAIGCQLPRIEALPPGEDHPDADDALDLVESAGITLDEWQKHVFRRSLRRKDGKWAAFEVALVVPRQNGKNELLVARELAGLFVLGEELLIHAAHEFATSLEAFRRLAQIVENTDWLLDEVKGGRRGIKRSHGEEGIELRSGQRIVFKTRTKGGGRGFSGDFIAFDEAMIFPEASLSAIMPVVSAQPDPQIWYTGSPVDQAVHEHGFVLGRLRKRGSSGGDQSLAYFEWSAPFEKPADVSDTAAADLEHQLLANPAAGIRISLEHIENERLSMDPRSFAVERLAVGDWPSLDGEDAVIDLAKWAGLERGAEPLTGLCLAVDVTPARTKASICAAGVCEDGKFQIQVVDRREGTGWIAHSLDALVRELHPAAVVCDSVGPAASLIPDIERIGVEVTTLNTQEHARACGFLFDAVEEGTVTHTGDPEFSAAIRGAARRPLGDSWAWSRKDSTDISPLVAATFALWAASTQPSDDILVAFA